MEKEYLSEKESSLFRRFLNLGDYQLVADHTGFSISTVHNIVHRRVKVSSKTIAIHKSLNVVAYVRMQKIVSDVAPILVKMHLTDEVKKYNNLKKALKWI